MYTCSVLESSVERAESERSRCELELDSAAELAATRQHQIATLTDLLDAAKAKVRSLELIINQS